MGLDVFRCYLEVLKKSHLTGKVWGQEITYFFCYSQKENRIKSLGNQLTGCSIKHYLDLDIVGRDKINDENILIYIQRLIFSSLHNYIILLSHIKK